MVIAKVEDYKLEVRITTQEDFKERHPHEFFLVRSSLDPSALERITKTSSDKTLDKTLNVDPNDLRKKLFLMDGDSDVYSFFLRKVGDMILVGRSDACYFIINSLLISHEHCKIEVGPDGLIYFKDNKSRNGTYINGERTHPHIRKLVQDKDFVGFSNKHLFNFYYNGTFYVAVKEFYRPKPKGL